MIENKVNEILVITQEEAAEVIQEVSKIFRFGIDSQHRDGMLHREKLEAEIGDLLCMIDLLVEYDVIDPEKIYRANQAKREKLKKYSGIFK